MFEHVAIHQRDSSDEDNTPPNPDVGRQRPSARVFPARQPSPMDEDKESHEDLDVQGGPQVPFNLQEMDLAANQPDRRPPSPDAMDRSRALVDDEIALVPATVEGRVVINISDVESYCSVRRLLGDSSDRDSDDDDKGVTHGVEMPSAPERRAVEVDAPSAALIRAGVASAPAVDDFYNAAGKAPHPDTIVQKQESGWWAAYEERKRRKAQERELAALQLCEVQEQAARLVEQNAALERELRDTLRSFSGAGPTTTPSTSAASVEGPVVVVPTPTGPAARPLSSHLASCAISLCANGSNVGGHEVYPRLEDTPPPSRSHYQSLEDSLQFQVEEDLESGDPSQGVHGLLFHDVGSGLLVEVPSRDDCEGVYVRAGGRRRWITVPLRSGRL